MRYIYLLCMCLGIGTIHAQKRVVKGNELPADPTIEAVLHRNYINKVYTTLLNRKPSSDELKAGLITLSKDHLSSDSRLRFISTVMTHSDYYSTLESNGRGQFLEGANNDFVRQEIKDLKFLLTKPSMTLLYDYWGYALSSMEKLITLSTEIEKGEIDYIEMNIRMVDNWIYRQINMGTENFVISTFQHFLNRYPTAFELAECKSMAEGRPGKLFLKVGDTRSDYLHILLESDNFKEAQIRNMFSIYLVREPTISELENYMAKFREEQNLMTLQKSILSSNEFAGIRK